MKHDYRKSPGPEDDARFQAWLETETTNGLRRSAGNAEGVKAVMFILANRAAESHMPDSTVVGVFESSAAAAGYDSDAEAAAFDLLEVAYALACRVRDLA